MLFLAIFCNFCCTNFPKISRGGKYCHFWIISEFLWNLTQRKWVKWPKIAFFGIKSCAKSRRFKIWPNNPYYLFSGFNWGVIAKIQLQYIFFLDISKGDIRLIESHSFIHLDGSLFGPNLFDGQAVWALLVIIIKKISILFVSWHNLSWFSLF